MTPSEHSSGANPERSESVTGEQQDVSGVTAFPSGSQGRRLPDATWPEILPVEIDDFRDGDYWPIHGAPEGPITWCVYYRGAARIPNHHVEEHEDGSISVLPQPGNSNSLLIQGSGYFHGYIRRGTWERA